MTYASLTESRTVFDELHAKFAANTLTYDDLSVAVRTHADSDMGEESLGTRWLFDCDLVGIWLSHTSSTTSLHNYLCFRLSQRIGFL